MSCRLWCLGAIVVASVANVGSIVAPAYAAVLYNFHVDRWHAGAYTDDTTHRFSHCAASVRYNSGVLLLFSISRNYAWTLGFASTTWRLNPGASYPIVLSVDRAVALRAAATAINNRMVSVPLADSRSLFRLFRLGYRLTVFTAGEQLAFILTGTSRILPALLRCVRYYDETPVAAAPFNPFARPEANPFAPPSTVASSPPQAAPPPDHHAEATALLANILSAAGITGFHLLAPGEMPRGLSADAAWRNDHAAGALTIVGNASTKASDVAPVLIGDDAKSCTAGAFASGVLPVQQQNGTAVASRAFSSCKTAASTTTVYYSILPRPGGGFYVLSTLDDGVGSVGASGDAMSLKISAAAMKIAVR